MYRISAAMLAVVSCASIAQAQTAAPPPPSTSLYTLDQALSAAGATAPSIDIATAGIRAADAARVVAGLRPNPQVQAQVENVGGTGSYKGFQSAETTAGLALPLELGGKRSARIAVADSRSRRALIEAAVITADLRERVTFAYIDTVAAEARLGIARQRAEFATRGYRAASVRVEAGAASPIEQQRADVERVNANVALARASRDVEVARANLARLTGQPDVNTLDSQWFERVGAYGPADILPARATLAVAAAQADVDTANAQVRLARAQRIPDITVSAGARRLSASNDTAAVFSVNVPLPLFNNGRALVSQAQAERQQADARRRVTELSVEQAIAAAVAEVANGEIAARAAAGPVLAAATEAARIARIGYAQGKFGQLELLDAERTLANTRTALVDALTQYHAAQARLARLLTPTPVPAGPGQ